jgi:hypothetical protein
VQPSVSSRVASQYSANQLFNVDGVSGADRARLQSVGGEQSQGFGDTGAQRLDTGWDFDFLERRRAPIW